MDKFQVKKVENCFKDSQAYEYKINMEINEGFLDKMKNLGKIEIKNFRRPIFMIDCENKNKIKGVLKSNIMRVSFPDDIWEIRKKEFEKYLDEIL